ncbi:hypothetical protein B0A50_04261 [Salinomyces thailandicus]|uniref:Uncharacterized protein n=1 Tax=Salinomyces thailandicus TaxID=706561 RepID=A0A4U0TYF8_9PEZI|nr:hypothetical protein B0A50_04261 [Salinomyces thailandica]
MQNLARVVYVLLLSAVLTDGVGHSRNSTKYLADEIQYLASLKVRLTGSPTHNASQLEGLSFPVFTDELPFTYYKGPLSEPSIILNNGTNLPVASFSTYSGFTGSAGVSGRLVDITTSTPEEVPDWEQARDAIALTNITNVPIDAADVFRVWPGSPEWSTGAGTPDISAEGLVRNLTLAADVGVKAVIYAWQNAATGLVDGQYAPFHNLYQGVPTLFVQGSNGMLEDLQAAAANGSHAAVTLEAELQRHQSARTIWTVIEGTDLKNESVILNTHTDGVNIIEENGHIALLAYARELAEHPPRRTTILLFVGQHMHFVAFAQPPQRATSRWLNTHPELWAGRGQRRAPQYGGQLKAVAGSCVEHLGAVHWAEDISSDDWYSTNQTEPELLYASTAPLNALLRRHWRDADPNVTRVTDPVDSVPVQGGEGYPFFLADIPNVSLVRNPSYLLKIWPAAFDEVQLVDLAAVKSQIESFKRVWRAIDEMSAEDIGEQRKDGLHRELHT